MFDDHIAPKYRDRAPRIVESEPGVQGWEWEGRFYPARRSRATRGPAGSARAKGPRRRPLRPLLRRHDAGRFRCPRAGGGRWTRTAFRPSSCSRTFPRFGGTRFLEATDRDLALACVQAWNDWMLDEWCASYPGPLHPPDAGPAVGPALAAARDRAVRREGQQRRSCSSRTPTRSGLPSFPSGHWDPVFSACGRHGAPPVDAHRHVVGAHAQAVARVDAVRSASRCAA